MQRNIPPEISLARGDEMAKNKSSPLTEDEIQSVYRNEFYPMDTTEYYNHRCSGGTVRKQNRQSKKELRKQHRRK